MALPIDSGDTGRLLLRLAIAGMLLLHGVHKLFHGIDGIERLVTAKGLPVFVALGVYLGEVIAPVLVLIGYRTRIAAMVVAINMVVAVVLAHGGDIARLGKSGGWAIELQMLYLFGAMCIVLLGAGRYSISRGRGRWD